MYFVAKIKRPKTKLSVCVSADDSCMMWGGGGGMNMLGNVSVLTSINSESS
jgi:hypothetical protein